ncbi:MAG: PDZ domain-containing protein [Verrucomicrobiota bacterium]
MSNLSVGSQLPKGKNEGGFIYKYSGRLAFTQDSTLPRRVRIISWPDRQELSHVIIKDLKPFTISAELPAGNYAVESIFEGESDDAYWNAMGPIFDISESGQLKVHSNQGNILNHSRKMKLVSPRIMELEGLSPPRLEWEALEGATSYWVACLIKESPETVSEQEFIVRDIRDTHLSFPLGLQSGCRYEWSVHAEGEGGTLGYFSSAYIFTGGAQVQFMRQNLSLLSKKGARLGVFITESLKGTNQGGVHLGGVSLDSPASRAGLRMGDVLLEVGDHSFSNLSSYGAAKVIKALPTDQPVVFKVKRGEEVLMIMVHLEAT